MAVTVGGTSITFNDGTVQSTASTLLKDMVANSLNSLRIFVKLTTNTTTIPNYTEGNNYTGTDLQGSTLAGTWKVISRPSLSGVRTYSTSSGDCSFNNTDRHYVILAVRVV